MKIQTLIEKTLQQVPSTHYFSVVNESHNHSVPANSETHFKVTIVDSMFVGMSRVKRHQYMYALLSNAMQQGIHALALHTYTPDEWQARAQQAPQSPQCLGGSKLDSSN